jgi:hypothetical protein
MKIVARCQLKPGQAFQPAFPRSGLGSETVASRIDEPQCPIGSSPRSQHSFLNAGTGPRRREESFSRIRVKRRVLARNAQIPPESRFLIRRSCRPHSSSSLPFHVSVSLITYLPCYVRFHSLLLLFSNPLYYRLACPLFNHSIISLVHFYNQIHSLVTLPSKLQTTSSSSPLYLLTLHEPFPIHIRPSSTCLATLFYPS